MTPKRILRALVLVSAVGLGPVALEGAANAGVYKYVKPDGTVVYTDSLAKLPPERRRHYNKKIAARKEARQQLEREIGKEELSRREAERQKEALARKNLDAAERAKQMAKIQAQIEAYRKRSRGRDHAKKAWKARMQQARAKLDRLLARFEQVQTEYLSIAIRPMHTLLPGQAKKRDDAKKELARLEVEIDAAIVEVEETIPEQARREGVPPGWLR